MNQLQNEIDESRHKTLSPPSGGNTIDQSRSSWSSSSHASSSRDSSSTNRNSLNASLFSSFTSSSSSLNPSSTTMSHTNESLSKSYQSSSSISNLTASDFVMKQPKSEYCTLPNMKKMRERPASKHAPLKRRDVEPPAIASPGGHRFEQINILRRSVSEMHLVKEKRFLFLY